MVEPLFNEFKYEHGGTTYHCMYYDDLKLYRLSKTHKLKRPFRQLADDIEHIREKYYEDKYALPRGYLAGIFYGIRPGVNINSFVKQASRQYRDDLLIKRISQIVQAASKRSAYEIQQHLIKTREILELQVGKKPTSLPNLDPIYRDPFVDPGPVQPSDQIYSNASEHPAH